MWKKHSMQVKMVKDQPATPKQMLDIDANKINSIVKESIKNIGIGIVAVAGSLIVLNTASEIAINASPKKH